MSRPSDPQGAAARDLLAYSTSRRGPALRGGPVRGAPGRTTLAILLGAGALLPAQETPTFRSDTQVVLLDLVARDRKGQPVVDLRADEVQVFEDGARCEIESFRLVRAPAKA